MTTPRYPMGCAAGSEVRGLASAPAAWSPGSNAWIVNFDNGNANDDHRDNENRVLLARPRECHDTLSLRALHTAYRAARAGKKPSANWLAFEARRLDALIELEERLESEDQPPGPVTCFVTLRPKAREIHAPDFSDRVRHHWVVPQLEAIFEPVFIHDSYANRRGKGSHAAVRRLRDFVHQVDSGQGGGWFLKLDIRNFFYSIHRPTLLALFEARFARAGVPDSVRRTVRAMLERHSVARGGTVRYACSEAERARVPVYKRLENAPPDCGLPIGDLFSQLAENVYLNELDQFVKHRLRARRYVRYVDDFVLVHQCREQLLAWYGEIEHFLSEHLRLALKPDSQLAPLSAGIDFLGYVIYPTRTVVRRRVVAHCREQLAAWARRHVRCGIVTTDPEALRQVQAIYASYAAHFKHAASYRLREGLFARFPWLAVALVKPRREAV